MQTGQFLTSVNSVMMLTAHTGEFNPERFWNLESVGVNPADNSTEDSVSNDYPVSHVIRTVRT